MTRAKIAVMIVVIAITAFLTTTLSQQYTLALQMRTQEQIEQEAEQLLTQAILYHRLTPEQLGQRLAELMQEYIETLPRDQAQLVEQRIQQAINNYNNNNLMRTEDDGYVYPKNATEEERAAIHAQERQAWEKAGRPGTPQ
jgi:K+-sensing histidine kinase KdpD